MKANLHSTDKVIRILIAIAVLVLFGMGIISGTTAIVLGAIAVVLLATVFINFCPIYHILGISTKKKSNQ